MFVHSGKRPLILRTDGSADSLTGPRRPWYMYHDYRHILIDNHSVDAHM